MTTAPQLIRVLLVDNHTLVRAGLRALLQNIEGIEVVAEAGDGREALRLIADRHPDVVLMDVAMPEMNGLEAAAHVVKEFPDVRVIILSMYANEEYVLQALRLGALGYLLKDAGINELELAIRASCQGETYLSPGVSKHIIGDYLRRVGDESSSLSQLTSRQREILQLIAEGRTTKEIALLLFISVKTVETHRMQLMKRLDIYDVAGLVRYAIRMGLVIPDS
ncbi:MAG: response regulator transcription factor [Cyanomargarita calcarea GSE-NOS-MK-12-04C]|jgi:DNA-binding NarL/FixJ family response regulator|uniref:Response regulator transcription factor n=1 Tax=Cyanomargarita calcarea GSE-NOS-MK-12-04C TaxID=2839659 RepID=A0A951UV12_9CYAN|nr:response regulator transcription factor [Cyanomargarita calcarea GSE-NOS-MK-12-04C]